MNIKNVWKIEVALTLALIGLLLGLALGVGGLRVNLTSSLPKGIYRLVDERPQCGDLVTFCLDSGTPFCGLAQKRSYLGRGSCPSGLQPLLKRPVGLPGDELAVTSAGLVLLVSAFLSKYYLKSVIYDGA